MTRPARAGTSLARSLAVPFAVTLSIVGCQPVETSARPTRQDVVRGLAEAVLLPAHEAFEASSADLAEQASEVCSRAQGTGADLDRVREAWRTARRDWIPVRLQSHGPFDARRTLSLVDWRPVSHERLVELLDEDVQPIDPDRVGTRWPASSRGLGVVEELLFGQRAQTLTAGSRSCDLLIAATAVIANEAAELTSEWRTDYVGRLAGRGSVSYESNEALGRLVRGLVFALRETTDRELLPALREQQTLTLGQGAAGADRLDLEALLDAFDAIYRSRSADDPAGSSAGLFDLVGQVAPATGLLVTETLSSTRAAVDELPVGVDLTEAENQPALESLYRAFDELHRVVATELVSVLGVSVGWSDADGDTG